MKHKAIYEWNKRVKHLKYSSATFTINTQNISLLCLKEKEYSYMQLIVVQLSCGFTIKFTKKNIISYIGDICKFYGGFIHQEHIKRYQEPVK